MESDGIDPIVIPPWQVTSVSWMFDQEESPIKGGILAQGYGLGRMAIVSELVYLDALRLARSGNAEFRPTLVLCPSELVEKWATEIRLVFGHVVNVRLFQNPRWLGNLESKKLALNGIDELHSFVEGLDKRRRRTGLTLILTTYYY